MATNKKEAKSEYFGGMYQWKFDEYIELCKAHYLFNDIR